jgi:hypothetical protein
MTIAVNATIEFFGTLDDLDSSSAEILDGGFSVAGDVVTPWTNDDDSPEASFSLSASFGTETDIAGKVINLYGRLLNIDGTNDESIPTATNTVGYLGSFLVPLANASDPYYMHCPARLRNYKPSSEYEFYLQNSTGQTITAGWVLKVTPVTVGPHPA